MSFQGEVAPYSEFEGNDKSTAVWYVHAIVEKLGTPSSPFRHIQNVRVTDIDSTYRREI